MKRILAISGSERKKGIGAQSYEIFKSNFPEQDYEFELLHLSDYEINFCKGCTACFKVGKCPHEDDILEIVKKIDEADGLVVISPIYSMNVSGQLKVFFDRTAYLLHQPRFYKKHAFVMVSTDLAGIKPVSFYLKYMMNAYGLKNTGSVGVLSYLYRGNSEYRKTVKKSLERTALNFMNALQQEEYFQPSLMQIIRFRGWQTKSKLSKESYKADYQYWKDNNWLDAEYYYPVKLSPVKKLVGKLVSKRMYKMMEKNLNL